jgi:hypothetical protein
VRRAVFASFVLAGALASTAAQGTTDRLGLSSIANGGRERIVAGPAMRAELQPAGAGSEGRVLARRDGRTFIEFARAGNGNCYGIQKRDAARFAFTCWSDFPSPAHPILDQSVFGADAGEPIHLIEAQGFAADGVSVIAVEDATGTPIARVPVVANVYRLEGLPKTGVRLVALDASGRVLFAVPR